MPFSIHTIRMYCLSEIYPACKPAISFWGAVLLQIFAISVGKRVFYNICHEYNFFMKQA